MEAHKENLSLSELIRLSPPFHNERDREEAFQYWKAKSAEERIDGGFRLTRAFYASLGVNVDAPMRKDVFIRNHSFEQENRESEQTDRAYAMCKAQVS